MNLNIVISGHLRVGSALPDPPFEFIDGDNAQGFDVELPTGCQWGDYYMLLADLRDYIETQERSRRQLTKIRTGGTVKAIVNVARAGKFSSDRTIQEYASQIWRLRPCAVVPQPIARPELD